MNIQGVEEPHGRGEQGALCAHQARGHEAWGAQRGGDNRAWFERMRTSSLDRLREGYPARGKGA